MLALVATFSTFTLCISVLIYCFGSWGAWWVPWDHKESDTTELLGTHTHTHTKNLIQLSCWTHTHTHTQRIWYNWATGHTHTHTLDTHTLVQLILLVRFISHYFYFKRFLWVSEVSSSILSVSFMSSSLVASSILYMVSFLSEEDLHS